MTLTTILLAVNTGQVLIGLLVGIVLLIAMVTLTKIHPFLALILSSIVVALIAGSPINEIPGQITSGFGSTLGSIGIIIGLGVIMGQIFEESGAAEKMAQVFIKLFGKGREHIALAVTGFVVSIPIFCDSAFVILFPIAKAISQKTRKNLILIAGALAAGLVITHTLVPPTPGPLTAANTFGVDLGMMILFGLIVAIPCTIAGIYYFKWLDNRLVILPDEKGVSHKVEKKEEVKVADVNLDSVKKLPSAVLSFAPILVPIILILLNNVFNAIFDDKNNIVYKIGAFIGNPVVAVSIGTLVAIYGLALRTPRKEALSSMDKGIKSAGIILLVTGAGGALGNVIKVTGAGDAIANTIVDWNIPVILLPFIVATVVRFIQGSGTVAIVTASSICAPIIEQTNASPLFAALAACVGAFFFSYFNDSYFHVVNRSIGVEDSKDQLWLWSGATTVIWAAGFITVMVLNLIFGSIL
ncbi:TPA: GntP family permease [bacterium]|nr:GntP family permease [bacterium]